MRPLSANTQAILLLTAPLLIGARKTASRTSNKTEPNSTTFGVDNGSEANKSAATSDAPDLLTPGEYKRLARHLRELQRQPADLIAPDAEALLRACQAIVDQQRLQHLLGRGFLLSQAVEYWQARAIWVLSRADAEYPKRLKARLRDDAPAIIYGCGLLSPEVAPAIGQKTSPQVAPAIGQKTSPQVAPAIGQKTSLLERGGLAVVGSRHVDQALIDYTETLAMQTARAGRTVISGGAKGIDQAAMRGAAGAGGTVIGVLADSLEKTCMSRENRNLLLAGQMVLISPYDPSAGFNVGHAMQRNKLIYALADAALVVSAELEQGGTWAGAVEQLDKLKLVPVYVRSADDVSAGLEALRKKGALLWPNPAEADAFDAIFDSQISPMVEPVEQIDFVKQANNPLVVAASASAPAPDVALAVAEAELQQQNCDVVDAVERQSDQAEGAQSLPSQFEAARATIIQLLSAPMKDVDVAAALGISPTLAKTWLAQLLAEQSVMKLTKPVRYIASTEQFQFKFSA